MKKIALALLSIGLLALVPIKLSYEDNPTLTLTCTLVSTDAIAGTQQYAITAIASSSAAGGIYSIDLSFRDIPTGNILGNFPHIQNGPPYPKTVYIVETDQTAIGSAILEGIILDKTATLRYATATTCL